MFDFGSRAKHTDAPNITSSKRSRAAICTYLNLFYQTATDMKEHPCASETPLLSVGRSGCPGWGTRALLRCSSLDGTLWLESSGRLQSAGFTQSDWQSWEHCTLTIRVDPEPDWLARPSSHLCEHGYWYGCLGLWEARSILKELRALRGGGSKEHREISG